MKTSRFKNLPSITFIISVMIILINQYSVAQDKNIIYLDSINYNDTVIYCSGIDSIKLIPQKDVENICWIINDYQDTICFDTLVLSNGYNGAIRFNSLNGDFDLHIFPFTIETNDDTIIICGDTIFFKIKSNNISNDTLIYRWTPGEYLNDSTIANPFAIVSSETKFIVTALTQEGCQSLDSVKVSFIPMPAPHICNVSVKAEFNNEITGGNVITWRKPTSESILLFNIYRETDLTDVYQKIGYVYYNNSPSFIDDYANYNMYSYKYKISILDNCGVESEKSSYHKTMVLHLDFEPDNILNLTWEPYEGINVSYYNFYKGTSPNAMELIAKFDISNTQYRDSVNSNKDFFFYQVEAIDTNYYPICTNPESTYISSFSNIATNNPTGINDLSSNSNFTILYPNPTTNEFTIENKLSNFTNGIVEILNAKGQLVKKVDLFPDKTIVNISNFNNGIYIVKINTNNGVVVEWIIKR